MAAREANVVKVADAQFRQEVLEAAQPVLVDFAAAWCAPCRALAPVLEQLAVEYRGRVKVAQVDVDDNQVVAQTYGVRALPTLLLFKGGRVVEQLVGAVPRTRLEDALRKVV
jgi:thioredoxin 1